MREGPVGALKMEVLPHEGSHQLYSNALGSAVAYSERVMQHCSFRVTSGVRLLVISVGVRKSSLDVDNTALKADHYGLRTVVGTKLLHDVPDMDLHGVFGYGQCRRNVKVAFAGGDQSEYFDLA